MELLSESRDHEKVIQKLIHEGRQPTKCITLFVVVMLDVKSLLNIIFIYFKISFIVFGFFWMLVFSVSFFHCRLVSFTMSQFTKLLTRMIGLIQVSMNIILTVDGGTNIQRNILVITFRSISLTFAVIAVYHIVKQYTS